MSETETNEPNSKRVRVDHDLKHYLEVAERIAREGGATILKAFNENKTVMLKSASTDLVTETDQKVEKFIIESFKNEFPTHSFIGEESAAAGVKTELTDNPTWIIDPLDGTTNFVHRFPFVAVSIALAIDKKPVVGVVYNCILNEMYTAIDGQGAFKNGQPISCSKQTEISTALIGTEFGSSRADEIMAVILENMRKLASYPNPAHSIRCLGSAALNMCAVACGAMDAYFESGIHVWDIAAGYVIVRAAGGTVLSPDGSELDIMSRRVLCGCTLELCNDITTRVKVIEHPRD